MIEGAPERRWVQIVVVVAMAVAVTGFLRATREVPDVSLPIEAAGRIAMVPGLAEAPTQEGIGAVRHADRGAAQRAALAALGDPGRSPAEPREPATETERDAVLLARAGRRAYDGAPPVVPHPIDQAGYPACLACHERGARIEGRTAPPMSHPPMASCVQCHVVATAPDPLFRGAEPPLAPSTFIGLEALAGAPRAWPGAPPVIPHATFMRERCASCHGLFASGIHTSHPERGSCLQCHAPSTMLEPRRSAVLQEAP